MPWRSSGWNTGKNVLMLLNCMERRGEVAVSGREGRERLWDLADRVLPDDPAVPWQEAAAERDRRRLASLGIARARATQTLGEPNDVADAGEPAVVEGVRGTWRVDPAQLGRPFRGRTALLSPLDRLVFDRKRMSDLFEFDYQLEMYKPAAARRWGYWAMPVLHGDRLVGKLDATADPEAGVLRVDALHEDEPLTASTRAAIGREIRSLAALLDLELDSNALEPADTGSPGARIGPSVPSGPGRSEATRAAGVEVGGSHAARRHRRGHPAARSRDHTGGRRGRRVGRGLGPGGRRAALG